MKFKWGILITNYELRIGWRMRSASKSLLSFVTGCRVRPGMTASLNIGTRLRQGYVGRRDKPAFQANWPVLSLIIPDIYQRVTCKYFKINMLKNEKTRRTGQNAGKGIFSILSIQNDQKGVFGENPPASFFKKGGIAPITGSVSLPTTHFFHPP